VLLPRAEDREQPSGTFERLAELAAAAESLGFDSVWVRDGPSPGGEEPPGPGPVFEPYTLLGALSVRTTTAALAVLPAGPSARLPSVMAKIVAGVDVISHGRSVLTLGTGPDADPAAAEWLAEELAVCRALLTEDLATFEGRHYRITGAPNRPRPVQQPRVPLVVAADRPELLDPVARLADALVVRGGVAETGAMVDALRRGCEDVGRDPGEVVVVWTGRLGTPAETTAGLPEALADAGVGGFVVEVDADDGREEIARLGSAVDAALTAASG
jgi:alkanesulfonate monooxygenase SsuD/methylene tetrahydromethanopterin reductase-like flavin-dependent oxidoreductase (luciferase family)